MARQDRLPDAPRGIADRPNRVTSRPRPRPWASAQSRAIAPAVAAHYEAKGRSLEKQIATLLQEEQSERKERQADMEVQPWHGVN